MGSWSTGICEANGIDMHYLRTGGNKPSLVLLHGLMANGACWTPLARALAKDYDIVMPDARGHGNSSVPDNGYNYENLAADVICLIDALRLATPVLLGHSMGGMTALVAASSGLKQLRGLVLVDPTFLTPQRQREVYESDVAEKHRQTLSSPREDLLVEMQSRQSGRSFETIGLLAKARFQTNLHAFEILRPPNPGYTQLIKALDLPARLIIGDVGAVISIEMAKELAKLNHHLEVVQIKEAGHGVPYDQPQCFSIAVQTFCDNVSA